MAENKISTLPFIYHPLRLLCALYHKLYYRRFEVRGKENIPGNTPVIFASCHQNALMDALAVLFASGRQTVFLARADIFKRKPVARLLRFLRILPVYRIRDGYSSLGQNQETFEEVYQVLKQKVPVGIFPEGLHLGMKKLKPLRKGIARMAFQAESECGFRLGLQVVPVGLDYSDYYRSGADLLVIFGKPLIVSDYAEQYAENPAVTINQFIEDLTAAMREVMIDIQPDNEYGEIKQLAEDLAKTECIERKIRPTLHNRFLLQKRITDRFNEAFQKGVLFFNDLRIEMTSHLKTGTGMSSHSGTLSRLLLLILLAPPALCGAILNSPPFFIPRMLTRNIKDPHFVSSVRFVTGFLLFLIWHPLLILVFIAFLQHIPTILALAVSLPLSAWIAIFWWRRFRIINVKNQRKSVQSVVN